MGDVQVAYIEYVIDVPCLGRAGGSRAQVLKSDR